MAENFIERRKDNWQRLETLLEQAQTAHGLRTLSRDEVRELGRSYRRTAADLAIARVESRDARLISYLNNLVIRAHGMIYRSETKGIRAIWQFYAQDFPAIFRQTWRFTLATVVAFLALALFSASATWRSEDFAEFAYVGANAVEDIKTGRKWWEHLNDEAPVGAMAIMTNNIGVALRTFAISIVPLVGTIEALRPTALQFGAINLLAARYGMKRKLWSFISGHGVLEFTAIFIAGGAGLMLGWALLVPGERTRREALIEAGARAIQLLAGCLPLLFLAGWIEAFISPSQQLPDLAKVGVGLLTGIGLWLYLSRSVPEQKLRLPWASAKSNGRAVR